MSNRVLAIIGFVIFTAMVLFELEQMNNHLEHLPARMPVITRTQVVSSASADDLVKFDLHAISTQLDVIAAIQRRTVIAEHPKLKPEIDYALFADYVQLRKSDDNLGHPVRFNSLALTFPDDFAALKARYLREHPGTKLPQ